MKISPLAYSLRTQLKKMDNEKRAIALTNDHHCYHWVELCLIHQVAG